MTSNSPDGQGLQPENNRLKLFIQDYAHFLLIGAALILLVPGLLFIRKLQAPDSNLPFTEHLDDIFISLIVAFAAIAFLILWRHTISIQKSNATQGANGKRGIDLGMVWFASAMLAWEFGAAVKIIDALPGYGPVGRLPLFANLASSFNSIFFLLALRTFEFDQTPSWFHLGIFRFWRSPRNIVVVTILVFLTGSATYFLSESGAGNSTIVLRNISTLLDTGLSTVVLILLAMFTIFLFRDRGISGLQVLVYVTMVFLLFVTVYSLLDSFRVDLSGLPPVFTLFSVSKVLYKIYLILIFFSLAYSYTYHLKQRELTLKINELNATKAEIESKNKELEDLRQDMNHTIRASLRNLEFEVGNAGDDSPGTDVLEALQKIRFIKKLHDDLHSHKSLNSHLFWFLGGLVTNFRESHYFASGNLTLEMVHEKEYEVRPKHARDLGTIVVELSLNAWRAYQKNGTPAHQRKLCVLIRAEGMLLYLRVSDDAGGMQPVQTDEALTQGLGHFGWKRLQDLAKDLGGTISHRPGDKGTICEAEIPLDKITLKSYDKTAGT